MSSDEDTKDAIQVATNKIREALRELQTSTGLSISHDVTVEIFRVNSFSSVQQHSLIGAVNIALSLPTDQK